MASNNFPMYRNNHNNSNSLVSSVFNDELNSFFSDPFNDLFFREPVSHLSRNIVTSDFPSADIYAEKDGTYYAELTVAGYKKDEIKVLISGDTIKVTLGLKPDKEDITDVSESSEVVSNNGKTSRVSTKIENSENKDRIYFQKGIKHPSYAEWSWETEDFKLDLSTAKVVMKDGKLVISAKQFAEAIPETKTLQIESE